MANLELKDLSLSGLKDPGFDTCCYSIDYKEINEISEWAYLENLSFNEFKIIGE